MVAGSTSVRDYFMQGRCGDGGQDTICNDELLFYGVSMNSLWMQDLASLLSLSGEERHFQCLVDASIKSHRTSPLLILFPSASNSHCPFN